MPMPGYAQIIVMILALAVVFSAGRGIYNHIRGVPFDPQKVILFSPSDAGNSAGRCTILDASSWQSGVAVALDASVRDAEAGQITEAEIDVDRAAGILQTARLHTVSAAPEFFSGVVDQLERVIRAKADTDRLAEHARLAEIALAELRSSMAGRDVAKSPSADGMTAVEVHAPRAVAVNMELNSKTLGGKLVDASSMPESAEISRAAFDARICRQHSRGWRQVFGSVANARRNSLAKCRIHRHAPALRGRGIEFAECGVRSLYVWIQRG